MLSAARNGLRVLLFATFSCSALPTPVMGASMLFDFDSGPGLNFNTFNSGDLFDIDTDGPTLAISKPADDRSFDPDGFISGGITSAFTFDGNYAVAVDFSLPTFPPAAEAHGLNESIIEVSNGDKVFLLLRLRVGSNDLIEAFTTGSFAGPIAPQDSNVTEGRYLISRVGSTLSAFLLDTNGQNPVPIGSDTHPSLLGPTRVTLRATQGRNLSGEQRAATALSVVFDNLAVDADSFQGVVPEPSTATLFALTGLSALFARTRRDTTINL